MAESGAIPRDPLRESISLQLDFINILYGFPYIVVDARLIPHLASIRLVQILAMQQSRRK